MVVTLSKNTLIVTHKGREISTPIDKVPLTVMSYILQNNLLLKPGYGVSIRPVEVSTDSPLFYWFHSQ